jgi:multimeric flavodoxin WrbA
MNVGGGNIAGGEIVKTGILYDSSEPESRVLFERIKAESMRVSEEVEVIDASEGKSAACICCFKCWTKTPGRCVLPRDGGTEFPEKFWDAKYVVIISRITWGGFSAPIKSYLDRLIPILHPYFRKVNGEMHHKLRYDSMPVFLAAGYGARTGAEADTFRSYTSAVRDQGGFLYPEGTLIVGQNETAEGVSALCGDWCRKEISK